ncbi:MAG: hypothetical protein GF384_01625 [Elusimicrobia bacterium]|nr:hypothetical protein [Elusimicrobiota bacterium]MBD3411707.1 hypothetical protein [Elusimicrobiota bacterium]
MMLNIINLIKYRTGIRLAKQGKMQDALNYFTQTLKKNPHDEFLNGEVARSYFKLNEIDLMKMHLRQALRAASVSSSTVRTILEMTNWRMIASPRYFNQTPAFSPDGKYVVFASAREKTSGDGMLSASDRPGLYRYNLLTGQEECIVDAQFYNSSPRYSPDGNTMIYLSARRDTDQNGIIDHRDNRALVLRDLSSGKEEVLVNDSNKVKHASFSPDGTRIIYYCTPAGSTVGNVYLMNIGDRRQINLTPGEFESTFPSISPDGQRYVFSAWRRDTNRDGEITLRDNSGIYCREFNSLREIEVAADHYDNSFPEFSPNSRYIMYLSRRRDTNHDGVINSQDNAGIYQFDLKRMKEKVLVTDSHYNKYPSYTPNGKMIVFMSSWRRKKIQHAPHGDYFEQKGIYAMNLVSWHIVQLVNDKYYSSHGPIVSPDSKHVVYTSWRKGFSRGLYIALINDIPSKDDLIHFIEHNFS